jgi:hypothetical protein
VACSITYLEVAHFRVGSNATEMGYLGDVRFPPISDRTADIARDPFRAKPGSDEYKPLKGNACAETELCTVEGGQDRYLR